MSLSLHIKIGNLVKNKGHNLRYEVICVYLYIFIMIQLEHKLLNNNLLK